MRRAPSEPAASSLGSGGGGQRRRDQFLRRELRRQARRAAARAVGAGNRGDQSPDRGRDRSLHLRRPVRDGRRALLAVVLRHRKSPNMNGACSPASHVEYKEEGDKLVSRLGGFAIDLVAAGEPAPYPTLCKGCFRDRRPYRSCVRRSLQSRRRLAHSATGGGRRTRAQDRRPATEPRLYRSRGAQFPRCGRRPCGGTTHPRQRSAQADRRPANHVRRLSENLAISPILNGAFP